MKAGTIFDSFLITDDVKAAEDFGNETWGATKVRDACTLLHKLYNAKHKHAQGLEKQLVKHKSIK